MVPKDDSEGRTVNAAKNAQIVAAARKLFLEKGFGETSMDAIAAEAGVSKPTLYSHFKNKIALFSEIIEATCAEIREGFEEEDYEFTTDDPPEVFLSRAVRIFARHFLHPSTIDLLRVVISESKRFPDLGDVLWESGPKYFCEVVSEQLRAYDAKGLLKVPDPDAAAREFAGILIGNLGMPHFMNLSTRPDKDELETRGAVLIGNFLSNLRT